MLYQHVSDIILDDVFLDLSALVPRATLWLKLEGLNPSGSIKFKTAVALLDDAEERGVLKPGGRVIETSSGNLGMALSAVCAARGYAFTCVVDPNSSRHSLATMRAFGAEVVLVDRRDGNGGFLHSRIDYIRGRIQADPLLVWPNQHANPANARVHATRTAAAILDELPDVDVLVVGAGTTGTLMGCVDHFRLRSPRTRIVAVDAVGSVTFGYPPGRRNIPGLGTSRRPDILRPDGPDEVILVAEGDAVAMCRRVAAQWGIAVGGSTGSVLSGVVALQDTLPDAATVVAIGPDGGDRYLDTVYDDAWVLDRLGADALAGARAAGRAGTAAVSVRPAARSASSASAVAAVPVPSAATVTV